MSAGDADLERVGSSDAAEPSAVPGEPEPAMVVAASDLVLAAVGIEDSFRI